MAAPNATRGAASAEPGRATSAVAPCPTAVGGTLRAAITVPLRIRVTAPGTKVPTGTAGSSTSTSLAAIERLRSASTLASVGGATRHAFSAPCTLVRASTRPGAAESAAVAGASSATAIGASTKWSNTLSGLTAPTVGTTVSVSDSRPSVSVPASGGAWRSPRSAASAVGDADLPRNRPAVAKAASTLAGAATSAVTESATLRIALTSAGLREKGSGRRGPISTWWYAISGPPPDGTATQAMSSSDNASTISPLGSLRWFGSCGWPHTPSGKRPNGRTLSMNGQACSTPPRSHVILSSGSRLPTLRGARPSAWLGGCAVKSFITGAPMRRTPVAGTWLVNVIENSTTTTNGRDDEPSGVLCSPLARQRTGVRHHRVRARLAVVGRIEILGDERLAPRAARCCALIRSAEVGTSARSGRPRT